MLPTSVLCHRMQVRNYSVESKKADIEGIRTRVLKVCAAFDKITADQVTSLNRIQKIQHIWERVGLVEGTRTTRGLILSLHLSNLQVIYFISHLDLFLFS